MGSIPLRPTSGLDDPQQQRRDRETINDILTFRFDDSRGRTPTEIAQGVMPTNRAYEPGDVRRYGGVGDGSTNNTTALINWALAASDGLELTLEPDGVYIFDPIINTLGVKFTDVSGFTIRGNGATIRAIAGAEVDGGNQLLYLTGCTDGRIENLTLDGNRANRTITADVSAANIQITTSCARLKFSRVRSINSCEDGWYVNTATEGTQATYPTDIVLEDCDGINSWRNNISVIGSLRFTIRGGRWNGANGTDPEAGIDIEPNSTTTFGNQDTVIDGPDCSDNTRYGVTMGVSGGAVLNERITIRNLRGQLNGLAFLRVGSNVKGLKVDGLWCGPHSAAITRGLVDLGADAEITDVELRNLHFNDITSTLSGTRCLIYGHGTITERINIDGVHVRNSTLPIMISNASISMNNLDARNLDVGVGGFPINIAGAGAARCIFRNIRLEDSEGYGMTWDSTDFMLENATFIDCASTVATVYVTGGASRSMIRGLTVLQTSSIPAGQKAIRYDVAPGLLTDFRAYSAGTDYTSANAISITVAATGAVVQDCQPPPAILTIASAATVTLPRVGDVFQISGTTTITSVTATGWDGQVVTLIFQAALTFTDGSNLLLAGSANFVTTADDTITLACNGTNWYEIGRAVN